MPHEEAEKGLDWGEGGGTSRYASEPSDWRPMGPPRVSQATIWQAGDRLVGRPFTMLLWPTGEGLIQMARTHIWPQRGRLIAGIAGIGAVPFPANVGTRLRGESQDEMVARPDGP
ncbi:hypothetical protein N7462_001672 [Penicillium macrosclerotiorum]|uniref:uncharacterized protein n=1 Tax=Penicillium macrosclerotiorum TaxID=303699 RepID=UPI002548E952|nr:uncharacterized protein N7462_001672 [Penicillium macrosclerotiorum]KAJ5692249.1 hypothetical protein N7462_001672 [Penicillium macrosclerotiorum]